MSHVYYLQEDNSAALLEPIHCQNEDKELQSLLEHNLHLLPESQISPEEQLHWLIVKREMPVVNPSTGQADWSIDFLLLDQNAVPTFVECKRYNDTRARREVVGQMLEYAANGKHYWTASDLRSFAQNTAGSEAKLDDALKQLTGSDISANSFFDLAQQNLQQSRLRLIFFLEKSSFELRSIVEFINGQFRDTEVLIVEARQYRHGSSRIIIPSVVGFTEEARVAKRESKAAAIRAAGGSGETAFWQAVTAALVNDEQRRELREFMARTDSIPNLQVRWAKSCLLTMPAMLPKSIVFTIRQSGHLEIYLDNWKEPHFHAVTAKQVAARKEFCAALESFFGISASEQDKMQFRLLKPETWLPKAKDLSAMLLHLSNLCTSAPADFTNIDGLPVK